MNNTDRLLGTLCALLVLISAVVALVSWNWSWPWGLIVLLTIGFGFWVYNGFRKLEVGWGGQLLYLGERQDYFFGEGWRWVPFPFGVKVADCRQTVMKLDPLDVITEDNTKIKIAGSIFRKIVNLHKYFSVEESGIKQGLDDIWDATIRAEVKEEPLEKVLKMHDHLGKKMHDAIEESSVNWGIEIVKVVIAGIEPDKAVMADLELKKREELQREGQKVEFQHFADRVKELMALPPTGPGLSREQAIEQVQLAIGKASKTIDAKTITLDPVTAALLGKILEARK